jgi:hypothetical protein
MKGAYDQTIQALQQHTQNKATVQANRLQSIHPVIQASQSNMSFDQLAQHNPAAAYHRANGTLPNPQQLQEFQKTITPVESQGLNQRDIDVLKEIAGI